MLKRVGLSLLMAAIRPATAVAAKIAAPLLAPPTHTSNTVIPVAPDATQARQHIAPAWALAPKTPELPLLDVNFCGECVPLDQSHVADRWKRVFTLFRSHARDLGDLRERADAFFPMIEPILEKYDIPDDFRYVPLAESGLRPKAVSRAGAAGYWQLMPGTARQLGLKVNRHTDERFNAKKATEAACRYLRELYNQLGSWSLVAAAYNVGPTYLKNQIRRNDQHDYYRMRLPRETQYYLFRVLLYKEVMSRPDDYSSFLMPVAQTAYRPSPLIGWQQIG